MWDGFVELIRATIFAGSHLLNGSLGASIILVSTLVRLALLPLMIRNARIARAQQIRIAQIKPRLDRLNESYSSDPVELMKRTQALYRENDIRMITPSGVISAAVQLPLIGGLFAAVRSGLGARVRFLWIADISRFDALLVTLVVGITGLVPLVSPSAPGAASGARVFSLLAMGGTLVFLWSASSAVALSVGAGAGVSVLQGWIMRRQSET